MPELRPPQASFATPFDAQIAFFKQKLNLPSEWWDDILGRAHDRAFMVAGAQKADLLQDLRGAVAKSLSGQITLDGFHKEFKAIVARNGWTGWTGEGTKGGEAWRANIIYQTNMASSYAAGRWKQLTDPELLKLRPYWRYHHADGVLKPRQQHVAWNGLVLPFDHPFWKTHFPPNGFGCHCWISAASQADFDAAQAAGKGEPPAGWDVPSEIDGLLPGLGRGWDYAPGAGVKTPFLELIDQKLINLDAPIGAAMMDSLAPILTAEHRAAVFREWAGEVLASKRSGQASKIVGSLEESLVAKLAQRGVSPATAEIAIRDEDVLHAHRDTKKGALPWEWYLDLPLHLMNRRAVILDTTEPASPALLYVFDLQGATGKVVLKLDYLVTTKGTDGIRRKVPMNILRSGREIKDIRALIQPGHEILEGKLE